ncbi:MAG: hypothetical protein MK212_10730 [Saprospiraceae bacterium]|nr:hypothetical protein [Saprospiraceae bacterium]
MKNLHLHNAQVKIELEAKPFASGGEGVLYRIKAPAKFRHSVAKLYLPPKRTKKKEQKLKYLLKNPPHESVKDFKQNAVVWVQDLIYQGKKFIGLILPFVHGKKLEVLCTTKLPKQLSKGWQRFSLANLKSMEFRLRVCFNLAAAIYQIHASQSYVLVDLKPDNVMIGRNGLVSIVDTDSVEVLDEYGQVLYKAPVATPEYTPVEYYSQRYSSKESVQQTWDRFGLAVIFYKILFGIHPFAASNTAPYDQLTTLSDKIREGLFVHAPTKQQYMKVVPPPHQRWSKLPRILQELFILCFERGHEIPELRPSAEEWCAALVTAIGDPTIKNTFEKPLVRHKIIVGQESNHIVPKLLIEADKNEKLKINSTDLLHSFIGKEKMPVLYSQIPDWDKYKASISKALSQTKNYDKGAIIATVILLIGIFTLAVSSIIPGFFVVFIVWNNLKTRTKKRLEQLSVTENIIGFRTKYNQLSEQLSTVQSELKKQVAGIQKVATKRKTKTLAEYKQKIDKLEEQRKVISKEEKKAYINLFEQSLNRLKSNPFIYSFIGDSIEDTELAIQEERQEILAKIKKESAPDKMKLNKDRLLFLERSREVEDRYKQELKQLQQDYENHKKWTVEERQKALNNVDLQTSEHASLKASAKQYLRYTSEKRTKLIAALERRGLKKVKDLAKVDYLAGTVQLNNEESTIIQLAEISDNPISLAMMLNNWKKSVRDKKVQKADKKRHIYKLYALKLEDIEQRYKKQKDVAFRRKEADIKVLNKQTLEEVYKQELTKNLGKYNAAIDLIKKVKKGQKIAVKDLQKEYKAKYNKMYKQAEELDTVFRAKLQELYIKEKGRFHAIRKHARSQELLVEKNEILLEIKEITETCQRLEAKVIRLGK